VTSRFLCIHGHFYQPPRENPWLEAVELQESAYPHHDWNERVTAECYRPNSASRLLDDEGRILKILSNYGRMSFNFGPTLLKWLADQAPDVYQAVLEADRSSIQRFSGHGSAMAQAYGHIIMPLASSRDKRTQVLWGIRDFEYRFHRRPEGMWLPETAVDLETLEIMAAAGIKFTVLAPHQAASVRRAASGEWRGVEGGGIETTMPYLLRLPSGRSISIFFYDGPASRAIAFEQLLDSGEALVSRLLESFSTDAPETQLVHVATDGESYGHHHRFGEMALAYALDQIESKGLARVTNYGEFLEQHPAENEVRILANSSWSCPHGVERWRGDCGCNTGEHQGWSQAWRGPLRAAIDGLREEVDRRYGETAANLLRDPWAARADYIDVVLDRRAQQAAFLERHALRRLGSGEATSALRLLELQRHAMLMYTSCGWFFDDVAGIEAVQVLRYACRVLQLARDLFDAELEPPFLGNLEAAKSNDPHYGDARRVYERDVRPAVVDLPAAAAHFAAASLFHTQTDGQFYCYTADVGELKLSQPGAARLALGRVDLRSEITLECGDFDFAAVHAGEQLLVGVRQQSTPEQYHQMLGRVEEPLARDDFQALRDWITSEFAPQTYSLASLCKDERQKIIDAIVRESMAQTTAVLGEMYDRQAPVMRFLLDTTARPLPRAFLTAAETVLSARLSDALDRRAIDAQYAGQVLEEAQRWKVSLDEALLRPKLEQAISEAADAFQAGPEERGALERFYQMVSLGRKMPFTPNLWQAQNTYCKTLQTAYPAAQARAAAGYADAKTWVRSFIALGEALSVRVD